MSQPLSGPDVSVFTQNPLSKADIIALDRLAAAAWPATERRELGGWLLRFAHGVSRRANSCAPFPLDADAPELDARIAAVEAFYRAHGMPPRFQISPGAEPEGLDAMLAARGYETESGVTILIAKAEEIRAYAGADVRIDIEAPDGWWDLYREGFGRDARAITALSEETPLYASASGADGHPAAIGFGVHAAGWTGIFGMQTRRTLRGRGIGTRVLGALAQWTVERGGFGLYLQVEDDNPAARRLYERLGFRAVYGYHYRTLWSAS